MTAYVFAFDNEGGQAKGVDGGAGEEEGVGVGRGVAHFFLVGWCGLEGACLFVVEGWLLSFWFKAAGQWKGDVGDREGI